MLPISLSRANSGSRLKNLESRGPEEEVKKKENHQNLTPEMMSKSNQVQTWRCGRTRALFFNQNWLNRAKSGVLHGTKKCFPMAGKSVSRVQKTQLARNNWTITSILSGLVTRKLYFWKKLDIKQTFSPSCRIWPIWAFEHLNIETFEHLNIWTFEYFDI